MKPGPVIAAALAAVFSVEGAGALELGAPVDCALGEDCFIQNYVDSEPGPEAKDFTCGALTYDGHQGTDFRVVSRADLDAGLMALAAAPGVVTQVVADQPDHDLSEGAAHPLDCGNAVILDHGAGWVSRYCHLAQDGVTVEEGQRVERGDPLGRVGASGGSVFPHLHYALTRYGAVVDPFTAVSPTGCDAPALEPLWSADSGVAYAETALLGFGVSGDFPDLDALRADPQALRPPFGGAADFYVWAKIMGARKGDALRFQALDPDGRMLANEVFRVDEDSGVFAANIGVETSDGGFERWPGGGYVARFSLIDGADVLFRRALRFTMPGSPEDVSERAEAERRQ